MKKILLVTPPFTQLNTPYPATAYLKGYLERKNIDAQQLDLSIETINAIFTPQFLETVFEKAEILLQGSGEGYNKDERLNENIERIIRLRLRYLGTIGTVMDFLRGENPTAAFLICKPDYLPQGGRFDTVGDIDELFGSLGQHDCAKHLCTIYLQDLSDLIRAVVSPHFELVRYAEKISVSVPSMKLLEKDISKDLNPVERLMVDILFRHIDDTKPHFVGFSIPFPGNLISSLICAREIKAEYPEIGIIAGGGYPSTELRSMTDKKIYDYFDYIVLDDGELAIERIVSGGELINTYTKTGYTASNETVSHTERGCPDYRARGEGKYLSLLETTNPMHRLWSDGRWNKMVLAHGCYWGKCAFCDTSLDYIKRYDAASAATIVDWMEQVMKQTGSNGFHFVDEAAPPKLLKEISLEILRRRLDVSWWTNIRFESAFTGDLCKLMAAAGCIAVSGGLEAASDRLLEVIGKGITIESSTIALRNFFRAGIMVHAYLMYGLPGQTLQETVDSLEIVRQMFRAHLIDSAFWHRYAMTVHSPSGLNPERYGAVRKNDHVNVFANNEIPFICPRDYDVTAAGAALNHALAAYMNGEEVDKPVHKWFNGKAPQTTIEETEITDHLIKPDKSRLYDANARIVFVGVSPKITGEGLTLFSASGQKHINLSPDKAIFMAEVCKICDDLSTKTDLAMIAEKFQEHYEENFLAFYHSKKWDIFREYGLLQV